MEFQTTRPFPDVKGNEAPLGVYPRSADNAGQLGPVTPTQGLATLDFYLHPFKVLVNADAVYVMPGWVFGLKNSQIFWRNQVQMNSIDLGNPFLGQTLPTLPWATGRLYLKITLSPSEVTTCEIVFETEANAKDTFTLKWIWIAELKADYLVEQHLKSDVFITPPTTDWSMITKNSITSPSSGTVRISEGCIMVQEFGTLIETDPTPTKLITRLQIAGNFKPEAVSALPVNDGDLLYIKISFSSDEYGDPGVKFYEAVDAEYIAVSAEPTDDNDFGHIYIGSVVIDGSELSIFPKPPGVITVPNTVLPKQSPDTTIDFGSAFFKATLTDTDEITIVEGWINWENIDITGTPGTLSGEHETTGLEIKPGLVEGDVICLVMVRTELTGTAESFPDNTSTTIWSRKTGWRYSSYSFEIFTGLPESDATKKIVPIAKFEDGKCKQLHIGATDCPAVFISSVGDES